MNDDEIKELMTWLDDKIEECSHTYLPEYRASKQSYEEVKKKIRSFALKR